MTDAPAPLADVTGDTAGQDLHGREAVVDDTGADVFVTLPVDRICAYDANPRHGENPEYGRIKASIRAKGILIARQSGFEVPADPDMEGRFAELKFLEHSIGRTGLLAMSPLFHFSDHDLWQYHMIGKR